MGKAIGYGVGYGFGFVIGFAFGVAAVYVAAKSVVVNTPKQSVQEEQQ